MSNPYTVIGTRPLRPDGVDKVTGRAVYGADVRLTGLLHGKVLRSPHGHARIRSIDASAARALPGVKAVITGADFPDLADKIASVGEGTVNLRALSHNCIARDKALYFGHPVAAVAATSADIAEEALKLILVDYEVLPCVLDAPSAMADGAPILHPDLRTNELGRKGEQPTNVASHIRHERGDLERGFSEAAAVVEREFRTSTVHQGYIEPQNATALANPDGFITVWCSTQGAFGVRDQTAEVLQLPVSRLKVVPTEIGGGFGGKLNVFLEPLAVMLSIKAGYRPVQLVMSRAEVLASTNPTSGSLIRVKIGADRSGRITAAQAWLAYEAGAFPGSPADSGAGVIFAPYRLDHVRIDAYDVVVNKPRTGAYRAPGGTNAAFASETCLDELAGKLGIDPLEFRLRNAAREGDRRADGPKYGRIGFVETLQAVQAHPHYTAPLAPSALDPQGRNPQVRRGRGLAAGFWFNWGGKSSASASVNPDGTVSLVEGSVDIGGSRASIAMQLAETLGIRAEEVKPTVVDTDAVGYNDVTGGSRTTFGTGWVAYQLGRALIAQLIERAALLWEMEPGAVRHEGGRFVCQERAMTFKELAARIDQTGAPVVVSASHESEKYGPGFGVHVVDLEVDTETGKVNILRYTAAQDVGTAIHPAYVEGQLQGGVAQGIGWALNEEYVYDRDGRLLNASFLDYRIPTALDLPMIDTVLVEVPSPGHPYGVRGVGETPIVPPAAAVANAIHRAIGARLTVLPMSPARILEALSAA
jgi:CO/xanthine dehydrogenase Mo-binding subunit